MQLHVSEIYRQGQLHVHYGHLIPAPVNQTSPSAWLYRHLWITCHKNKPITLLIHVVCELKQHSVACEIIDTSVPRRLDGNQTCSCVFCPGSYTFSAGIKCRHCTVLYMYMCDVSMLNVYDYGIYILETNGVLLEI